VRASVALAVVFACSPAPTGPGTLTVGVDGQALGSYIQSIHVVTTVDGTTETDTVFRASQGPVFPHEVKVDGRGDVGAAVGVRVEGFASDDPSASPPAIIRTAETTMQPAPWNKLLRIDLDTLCVLIPPQGGIVGPTCAAPSTTCIGGQCTSDLVDPNSLGDYSANWPSAAPDACRPANPGAPNVIVGTGQNDYFPLTDGQTVQAQAGPQGGHHIWIAVRMQNLKQSSSTTTVTATQPGTGATVSPYSVVFTFLPDEGGFCKLYGLRFQLDANGVDYTQFLGKPLDVTVAIHDVLGEDGTGVAHVNIDPNVLPL
jgi:hypothetical protein